MSDLEERRLVESLRIADDAVDCDIDAEKLARRIHQKKRGRDNLRRRLVAITCSLTMAGLLFGFWPQNSPPEFGVSQIVPAINEDSTNGRFNESNDEIDLFVEQDLGLLSRRLAELQLEVTRLRETKTEQRTAILKERFSRTEIEELKTVFVGF